METSCRSRFHGAWRYCCHTVHWAPCTMCCIHRCNCCPALHVRQARSHQPGAVRSYCFPVALRFEPWSPCNTERKGSSLCCSSSKQDHSGEVTAHVLPAHMMSRLVAASQLLFLCLFPQGQNWFPLLASEETKKLEQQKGRMTS